MNPSQGKNLREDDNVPNVEEEENRLVQIDEQVGSCERIHSARDPKPTKTAKGSLGSRN